MEQKYAIMQLFKLSAFLHYDVYCEHTAHADSANTTSAFH